MSAVEEPTLFEQMRAEEEPIVLAVAGRFEVLANCYVLDCGKVATRRASGGPVCRGHYWWQRRMHRAEELWYDPRANDAWVDEQMERLGWPSRTAMDAILGTDL